MTFTKAFILLGQLGSSSTSMHMLYMDHILTKRPCRSLDFAKQLDRLAARSHNPCSRLTGLFLQLFFLLRCGANGADAWAWGATEGVFRLLCILYFCVFRMETSIFEVLNVD